MKYKNRLIVPTLVSTSLLASVMTANAEEVDQDEQYSGQSTEEYSISKETSKTDLDFIESEEKTEDEKSNDGEETESEEAVEETEELKEVDETETAEVEEVVENELEENNIEEQVAETPAETVEKSEENEQTAEAAVEETQIEETAEETAVESYEQEVKTEVAEPVEKVVTEEPAEEPAEKEQLAESPVEETQAEETGTEELVEETAVESEEQEIAEQAVQTEEAPVEAEPAETEEVAQAVPVEAEAVEEKAEAAEVKEKSSATEENAEEATDEKSETAEELDPTEASDEQEAEEKPAETETEEADEKLVEKAEVKETPQSEETTYKYDSESLEQELETLSEEEQTAFLEENADNIEADEEMLNSLAEGLAAENEELNAEEVYAATAGTMSTMSLSEAITDINQYIADNNFDVADIKYDYIPNLPKYAYHSNYGWDPENGEVGKPKGVVLHDVGNENSTIYGEIEYMSRNWENAFVHAFVDADNIIQVADTDYLAYGAGPYSNDMHMHVELMRYDNAHDFAKSINNYADYIANLLYKYKLPAVSAEETGEGTLWSHVAVSHNLGGTASPDPYEYFARFDYEYNDVINLITDRYNDMYNKNTTPQISMPIEQGTTDLMAEVNTNNLGLYESVKDVKTKNANDLLGQQFHVVRTATYNYDDYYLLEDENGVSLGWMYAGDLTTSEYVPEDEDKKPETPKEPVEPEEDKSDDNQQDKEPTPEKDESTDDVEETDEQEKEDSDDENQEQEKPVKPETPEEPVESEDDSTDTVEKDDSTEDNAKDSADKSDDNEEPTEPAEDNESEDTADEGSEDESGNQTAENTNEETDNSNQESAGRETEASDEDTEEVEQDSEEKEVAAEVDTVTDGEVSSSLVDSATGVRVVSATDELDGKSLVVTALNPSGAINAAHDLYDIHILDENGLLYNLQNPATVYLPANGYVSNVYYLGDIGETLEAVNYTTADGYAVFGVNSFSQYAVVYGNETEDNTTMPVLTGDNGTGGEEGTADKANEHQTVYTETDVNTEEEAAPAGSDDANQGGSGEEAEPEMLPDTGVPEQSATIFATILAALGLGFLVKRRKTTEK